MNRERMSIRMNAETMNADKETVNTILHNKLNMKNVFEKSVPTILTLEQNLVSQKIGFLQFLNAKY